MTGWRLGGLAVFAASGAVGCGGGGSAPEDGPAVDSALVDALAEVHLADARAALVPDSLRRPGTADSLRRAALRAHGFEDPDAFERRLDALADDPDRTRATYDAVADRLSEERRSSP